MNRLQKQALREIMKEKRGLFFQQHPEAGEKIADLFFSFFDFPLQTIIGAYWPMGSELDTRPLLHRLTTKGFSCALPCVTSEGLLFREWDPSLNLVKGPLQLLEPPLTAPLLTPDVLLVPLLAFDKKGHRLGYGKGHYDHYLHYHSPLTIGVGFKDQGVDNIPHEAHDIALNFILTEVSPQTI
jgi:5-formyltetrahydrofolate cyclo-ligase